jgi:PTH2 family peptidyl-tRNA hydrolase
MGTKQVIVVRKDLKMNPGKLAAQCCHASMGAFFEAIDFHWHLQEDNKYEPLDITAVTKAWLEGSFVKIVLRVDSEQELLDLYQKVKEDLYCCLIKDSGRTVFKEPTYTCIGIGPHLVEDVDKYIGHLKLL